MICALEANTEVMAYEIAKAEREKAELERIKRELAAAEQSAITLCETEIAEAIYSRSKIGGHYCEFTFSTQNLGARRICRKLKEEKVKYADGRYSYHPSGILFDLDAIVKYLRSHCYDVEIKKSGYWSYGLGWQSKAVDIVIHW